GATRSSTPCIYTSPNTPTHTAIYPLSLHDALPIFHHVAALFSHLAGNLPAVCRAHRAHVHENLARRHSCQHSLCAGQDFRGHERSEEHTSELQSRENLVCRLMLVKKNKRRGNGVYY